MSELKCCPFCGGEAREYKQRFSFYGEAVDMACCDKCGFSLVKSVWNTRTPMANIVEKLEERRIEYELSSENAPDAVSSTYRKGVMRGYEYSRDLVKQEINNGLE